MGRRTRLDDELVRRGLAASRDEALRLVLAGDIHGESERYTSPATPVNSDTPLYRKPPRREVGRGYKKLEKAFSELGFSTEGSRAVDVGCSTGGFTQCLLDHGAEHVTAVDVGYAQFAWTLRNDPRVELAERQNIVSAPEDRPEWVGTFDRAVSDVSFTSLLTVLPAIDTLLADDASMVLLVKPQFEAPREDVGPGGVVVDPAVRQAALRKVSQAVEDLGFEILGTTESPIRGTKGNVEYLLHARKGMRP